MAKKAKKAKTVPVCVQDESDPLDSDGKVVQLPEDFMQGTHEDALTPPQFPIRVRGTALCYYRGDPKCPTFTVSTLNVMQVKKVREAVDAAS